MNSESSSSCHFLNTETLFLWSFGPSYSKAECCLSRSHESQTQTNAQSMKGLDTSVPFGLPGQPVSSLDFPLVQFHIQTVPVVCCPCSSTPLCMTWRELSLSSQDLTFSVPSVCTELRRITFTESTLSTRNLLQQFIQLDSPLELSTFFLKFCWIFSPVLMMLCNEHVCLWFYCRLVRFVK